ncbi:hypothetical protein ACI2LF_21660 [Kribbella sp. NPDC020789]
MSTGADVDVWVVQEVENVDVLREFNREHLNGAYRHVMVIDGNDATRFIDIGLLSRRPIGGVTSYQRTFHPDVPDATVPTTTRPGSHSTSSAIPSSRRLRP